MSTISPEDLPPFGPLYGAFYFSAILATAFYGVTCMQTFFYYINYPNDSLYQKIFVGLVWALNSVHEALVVSGTYKYIMGGLLNSLAFVNLNPDIVLQLFFTCLVGIASQGFFIHRIYVFSGKKFVVPLIWVPLAILQSVSASMLDIKDLHIVNGSIQVVPITTAHTKPYTNLGTIYLSVAAGVDILIALCMTFLLLRKYTGTEHARTAHILQRLITFSVNTGIWSATFALLTVILIYVFPSNVIYALSGVPICEVYCNTLLANLNARVYIRNKDTAQVIEMEGLRSLTSSIRVDKRQRAATFGSSKSQGIWKTTEVMQFPGDTKPTTPVRKCVDVV